MKAPILRKIEAELVKLFTDGADHPIDRYDVLTIAHKVGAQAEMIEQEIGE